MFSEFWNALDGTMQFYFIILLCFIPVMLIGVYAQYKVNATFKKYSALTSKCLLSGAEVASGMLSDAGLSHVPIQRTSGRLTDHYDPKSDAVFLSEVVYRSSSMSAAGVACHEAGHAVQHNENYVFAKVRNFLVPVVNFSSRIFYPILLLGFILNMLSFDPIIGNVCLYISLILFSLSTLFILITLPTEFNASRRALRYLKESGQYSAEETAAAKKVLTAAAMTYVASFLMSLLQLFRLVSIFLLRSRRR